MKSCLFAFCLGFFATALASDAATGAPAVPPSTNNLVILSERYGEFTSTNVFWFGQVRAGDGEMYLECELLTAYFNTNSVRTTNTAKSTAPRRDSDKTYDTKFERVVAETNVMIIFSGRQIVGDRAEYYATNDLLVVTGTPVIVEDDAGMMLCDKFIHHRESKRTEFFGQNIFIGTANLMSRSNSPSGNPKTNAPPSRK